jgi:hypothetical protein
MLHRICISEENTTYTTQLFGIKLQVENTVDEIENYQQNWLQDVKRMQNSRLPRIAVECKPKADETSAALCTRWSNQQHL